MRVATSDRRSTGTRARASWSPTCQRRPPLAPARAERTSGGGHSTQRRCARRATRAGQGARGDGPAFGVPHGGGMARRARSMPGATGRAWASGCARDCAHGCSQPHASAYRGQTTARGGSPTIRSGGREVSATCTNDSGSSARKGVGVRVPPSAPQESRIVSQQPPLAHSPPPLAWCQTWCQYAPAVPLASRLRPFPRRGHSAVPGLVRPSPTNRRALGSSRGPRRVRSTTRSRPRPAPRGCSVCPDPTLFCGWRDYKQVGPSNIGAFDEPPADPRR